MLIRKSFVSLVASVGAQCEQDSLDQVKVIVQLALLDQEVALSLCTSMLGQGCQSLLCELVVGATDKIFYQEALM